MWRFRIKLIIGVSLNGGYMSKFSCTKSGVRMVKVGYLQTKRHCFVHILSGKVTPRWTREQLVIY